MYLKYDTAQRRAPGTNFGGLKKLPSMENEVKKIIVDVSTDYMKPR